MEQITFYFIPGIVLLGIITSYYDLKENRIPNFAILGAVIYAVLMNVILIFFLGANLNYYLVFLINAIIASGMSFFLFYFRVWAPGDAKLFIAYALLLPLSAYKNFFVLYYPSLILFTNTFVIATVSIAPSFFLKLDFSLLKKKLLSKGLIIEFLIFLYALLSLSWLMMILRRAVADYFILYVLVFLIYMGAKKLLKKKQHLFIFVLTLILLVRALFYPQTIFSYSFLGAFFKFSVFFFIFKKAFVDIYPEISVKKIRAAELKPYMVLKQDINSGKHKLKAGRVLTSSQIKKVKYRKIMVLIKENIPFAPLLFIGALMTIFISGEVIHWLLALLK